jgi:hypothetical protein
MNGPETHGANIEAAVEFRDASAVAQLKAWIFRAFSETPFFVLWARVADRSHWSESELRDEVPDDRTRECRQDVPTGVFAPGYRKTCVAPLVEHTRRRLYRH